ncbi:MAG: hypothetical protein MUF28_04300 [Ignavibacterium sp.]|nr:hypothetical protein [Ignavibacterium sp.]
MLSNNLFKSLALIFIVLGSTSCSDKEEKIPVLDYQNKVQVLDVVKNHFNKDIQVAFAGLFEETGKQFIAAGWEVSNSNEWGIKFSFLEKTGNKFISKYETELLAGSFKESFVDKIKFSSIDYDLVYYNSQSYFLGSGGGEVFSYIIDFENKQVYYAHLIVESESSTSLFISENTSSKELLNFFTLTFKKDYPGLKLVQEDIIVD